MKTLSSQLVRRCIAGWVGATLVWGGSVARAQEGIGDVVYTVGTTAQDSAHRDWAYLVWQATSSSLLTGRVFAVYAKLGEATNPAPYVRQSIVQLQTDARVIEPLLRRSENVGQDSVRLQSDMEELFGPLMPTNTIDRAVRLSAVIRGSLGDPNHYQNLLMLARNHPGVSLCLGNASAEMIAAAAKTTFEVRVYDPTTEKDLAVIGRVTVEAGNPTLLPAPGAPVLVPDSSPKGDINLKFRWGTPDDLRRFGLMQFGFNLYRVTSAYAEAQGWNYKAPLLSQLTNLAATQPNLVKQVNRLPIIPRKQFTLAEAALVVAPGDTNTLFIADDDGRFLPGYVNYGFTNGATYYYFTTARDVLGRAGIPSTGLWAKVCDRMPPLPPSQVRVFNDYTNNTLLHTQRQALRVVWNQVTNYTLFYSTNATTHRTVTNRSETVSNYWIYRWSSVTQMNTYSGNLSNHLIAVVPHVAGRRTQNYLDDGAGAPHAPEDWSKTYWYTVRAGDASACGQNLSAPSGPAYGVLRDRVGPDTPNGQVLINCLFPVVNFQGAEMKYGTPDTNQYAFHLFCRRLHPNIEWADFYSFDPAAGTSVFLNRKYFPPGSDTADLWYYLPDAQKRPAFICRVGASNGRISDVAKTGYLSSPETRRYRVEVTFVAVMTAEQHLIGARNDDCQTHSPTNPATGIFVPPVVVFLPAPTSREYRVYRRVDDGPLSLICQGLITNTFDWQSCTNDSLPANPGTICYYVQTLDEHGNPSALTNVACFSIAGRTDPPTPRLAPITGQGDNSHPQMKLVWFCPPYGVDRFEVWVGDRAATPDLSKAFSSFLTYSNYAVPEIWFTNKGQPTNFPFYVFRTPRVGPGFGNGATFTVPVNVKIGRTYAFFVKAVGADGAVGQPSNVEMALWGETNLVEQVPWPARPLVETNANYVGAGAFLHPQHTNLLYRSSQLGNAVWLGWVDLAGRQILNVTEKQVQFRGLYDPNEFVFTNYFSQRMLPAVLYRYQVPNDNFPSVSGDVVQVSPLIEQIAYGTNSGSTILLDPFIDATSIPNPSDDTRTWVLLWLRDTQPQISGAAYRYLLVRFNPNREIDQIVPTTPVEVP